MRSWTSSALGVEVRPAVLRLDRNPWPSLRPPGSSVALLSSSRGLEFVVS